MKNKMKFLFTLTIIGVNPANAGGLIYDFRKQIGTDVGKVLEKSIEDTEKSIEKAKKDAERAVEKSAQDAGKSSEKAVKDAGKTIDKSVQDIIKPIHMVDAKSLTRELFSKSSEELFSLSVLTFPCSEIECRGLPTEIIRTIISQVKTEKQNITDLEVRKSQSIAAVASAGISLLSLFISVASFYRASRAIVKN